MSDTVHYDELRQQMVVDQLQPRGIHDPRVLEAMKTVPREIFVSEDLQEHAYADGALPIDCDQTISQPLIVAMMSEAMELNGTQKVLEIGTGSGYQAAILSMLAAEVITIERHEPLSRAAAAVLAQTGCENVRTLVADGTQGYAEGAPFDRIIVTAAADRVPPALLEQLVDDGRLVIPLGSAKAQTLTLIHKTGDRLLRRELTGCRFVPLISDASRQG